eukprot:3768487-Pyramimonas_sp.AAC.1
MNQKLPAVLCCAARGGVGALVTSGHLAPTTVRPQDVSGWNSVGVRGVECVLSDRGPCPNKSPPP